MSLENEVGIFPHNMDYVEGEGGVEDIEKGENSLFDQKDEIQTHTEVEDIQDDIQLVFKESAISAEINSVAAESCQEDQKSSPYSIGRGTVMPTFRVR